jgi:hypothetical protein
LFALNLRWLLRDFLLELVDEEGRRMTPDERLGGSTDSAAAHAQLLSLQQSECEVKGAITAIMDLPWFASLHKYVINISYIFIHRMLLRYLESSLHKAPPEGADSKRSQAAMVLEAIQIISDPS